jgi:hypothetical protein
MAPSYDWWQYLSARQHSIPPAPRRWTLPSITLPKVTLPKVQLPKLSLTRWWAPVASRATRLRTWVTAKLTPTPAPTLTPADPLAPIAVSYRGPVTGLAIANSVLVLMTVGAWWLLPQPCGLITGTVWTLVLMFSLGSVRAMLRSRRPSARLGDPALYQSSTPTTNVTVCFAGVGASPGVFKGAKRLADPVPGSLVDTMLRSGKTHVLLHYFDRAELAWSGQEPLSYVHAHHEPDQFEQIHQELNRLAGPGGSIEVSLLSLSFGAWFATRFARWVEVAHPTDARYEIKRHGMFSPAFVTLSGQQVGLVVAKYLFGNRWLQKRWFRSLWRIIFKPNPDASEHAGEDAANTSNALKRTCNVSGVLTRSAAMAESVSTEPDEPAYYDVWVCTHPLDDVVNNQASLAALKVLLGTRFNRRFETTSLDPGAGPIGLHGDLDTFASAYCPPLQDFLSWL